MKRALLAALTLSACGTVVRTEVERQEGPRRPAIRRVVGAPEVRVTVTDGVVRVRAARPLRCARVWQVEGVDVVSHRRSLAQPAWVHLSGVTGSLLVGGALFALVRPPEGSPVSGEALAGALGLGAVMMIPWVYAAVVTGTTVERRPYRTEHPDGGDVACGEAPVARAPVVLRLGGRALATRSTDADGTASIALGEAVPAGLLDGSSGAAAAELTVSGAVVERVSLEALRRDVRDARWAAAATPEALDRFAAAFPDDPRALEATRRAASLRADEAAAGALQARRAAWAAVGADPARRRAFADAGVGDVFEAEVACSLAAEAPDAALRDAEGACARALAAAGDGDGAPEVLGAATSHHRDARGRLGPIELAARMEVEQAAQAREADATRARERRRGAQRAALAQVTTIIDACRRGGAGASPARAAYELLARVGAPERMVLRVASACRCTPTCAGVTLR